MAQTTTIVLTDDLTGEEGTPDHPVTTTEFGLDGVGYEIELALPNRRALEEILAPYMQSGRRTGGRIRRPVAPAPVGAAPATNGTAGRGSGPNLQVARRDPAQTKEIRRWAQENGHDLSDRGRIPAHIEAAWQDAHATTTGASPSPGKRRRG